MLKIEKHLEPRKIRRTMWLRKITLLLLHPKKSSFDRGVSKTSYHEHLDSEDVSPTSCNVHQDSEGMYTLCHMCPDSENITDEVTRAPGFSRRVVDVVPCAPGFRNPRRRGANVAPRGWDLKDVSYTSHIRRDSEDVS